jgi:hypothetical protein
MSFLSTCIRFAGQTTRRRKRQAEKVGNDSFETLTNRQTFPPPMTTGKTTSKPKENVLLDRFRRLRQELDSSRLHCLDRSSETCLRLAAEHWVGLRFSERFP